MRDEVKGAQRVILQLISRVILVIALVWVIRVLEERFHRLLNIVSISGPVADLAVPL